MKRLAPGLVGLVLVAALSAGRDPQPPAAEPVARAYAAAWTKGDYPAMWALLTEESKARVGGSGFLPRRPRIGEQMTLKTLEATTGAPVHPAGANGSPDPRTATTPLSVTF